MYLALLVQSVTSFNVSFFLKQLELKMAEKILYSADSDLSN